MRLLLFFLSLLLPNLVLAQAQQIGFSFTPPPADLSVAYLSDIFGVVDGVLHGTGSQILGTMFGVFNAAILTIGGVVITYILFVSTLNTAHDGKVMGQKWSSIWIPLRAVMGIAAMLPKATGYSFIQIFLMWLVVQGIGAADSIWYTALNYFQRGGILVQHVQSLGQMGAQNLQIIFPAGAVLKSETCMYTLRNSLQNIKPPNSQSGSPVNLPPVPDFTSSMVVTGKPSGLIPPCYKGDTRTGCSPTGDSQGVINFPGNVSYAGTNYQGVCGTLTWSFSLSTDKGGNINYSNAGAYDSRSIAAQQIILELQPLAYMLSQAMLPTGQSQTGRSITPQDLPNNGLINPATDYFTIMKPSLNAAGQAAAQAVKDTLNSAAQSGWLLAGSYYFTISRLNQMVQAFEGSPPTATYPTTYSPSNFNAAARTALSNNLTTTVISGGCDSGISSNPVDRFICTEFLNAAAAAQGNFVPPSNPPTPSGQGGQSGTTAWWQQNLGNKPAGYVEPTWLGFTSRVPTLSWSDLPIEKIRDGINAIPNKINDIMDNLQSNIIALGSAQKNNIDPILSISNLGYQIIDAIEWLWIWGAVAVAAGGFFAVCSGSSPLFTVMTNFLLWFVPLLTAVLFAMFIAGAVMAYYVPLIPLIVFLFTVIGWFVAVIEAMIAGPIVALGLISPEGHEYFGQAQNAIMLILNVFIRPTLIIFGFVTAAILVNVALWVWNIALGVTMSQDIIQKTVFVPFVTHILSVVAILVIYMTVVLSIVNRCFALIHEIPSHVLTWIGANIRSFGEERGAQGIEEGFRGGMAPVKGGAEGVVGAPFEAGKAGMKELKKRKDEKERKAGGGIDVGT